MTYGDEFQSRDVRGVEPQTMVVRNTTIAAGRPITAEDVHARRRVAVLGHKARLELLGPQGRIGATIRVLGTPHEVVGFFEPVGTQLTRDADEIDEQIWVPLSTLLGLRPSRVENEDVIDIIVLRARSREIYDDLKREIQAVVGRRLGVRPDDEEAMIIVSPIENVRNMQIDRMTGMLFVLAVTTLGPDALCLITSLVFRPSSAPASI